MLNGGYWEQFKEYYDTFVFLHGEHEIRESTMKCIDEIIAAKATFLSLDRPYDHNEIFDWVLSIEEMIEHDETVGSTRTVSKYPSISEYSKESVEIGRYFFNQDIELFKNKIISGDKEFIDEAVRLKWDEMLSFNPLLKDVFYF